MFNKATLVGRVGKDPEILNLRNGKKGAKFSLATSESWQDKASGEWKNKTEWHNITVWSEGLAGYVERSVRKGDVLLVEGKIERQEYEKDGEKRHTTNIVLQGFNATIRKLNSKGDGGSDDRDTRQDYQSSQSAGTSYSSELDDDIPF